VKRGQKKTVVPKTILEADNISKAFGGVKAVNKVHLAVKENDIHALLGPNGAGKSTFFNLVSKYLGPDEGKVIFKGRDITNLEPHQICRLGIARSFQRISVFPKLTVFESTQMSVLSHGGRALNLFRPANKMFCEETMEILEAVGLVDQAHVLGNELSQGDKKRLDLAITLGNQPELLLLDEPTAGMSPEETVATTQLIHELAVMRGLTILFTEHDMSVVFGIAKRITVMHQGAIIADGEPEEVRKNARVQKIYLGEEE
jgi:branched-chain amino acid transport system ATP-binding protein